MLAVVIMLPGFTAKLLPGNTFKTLSNTPVETQVAADLRLIFADGISGMERDVILDSTGLRIVSGPDDRGLYLVSADSVSASVLAATLEQLRSNEKIMFAEFVNSTAPNGSLPGEQ